MPSPNVPVLLSRDDIKILRALFRIERGGMPQQATLVRLVRCFVEATDTLPEEEDTFFPEVSVEDMRLLQRLSKILAVSPYEGRAVRRIAEQGPSTRRIDVRVGDKLALSSSPNSVWYHVESYDEESGCYLVRFIDTVTRRLFSWDAKVIDRRVADGTYVIVEGGQ